MHPQSGHQKLSLQHYAFAPSDSASLFGLDPAAAAKHMATLNSVNQSRTATGPAFVGGPSLAGILGGGTGNFAASHDPTVIQGNGPTTFPLQSSLLSANPSLLTTHPSKTPRGVTGANLAQRQLYFLTSLAAFMAKRNTPLPPSLTGVRPANYDPSSSPWSFIEPSPEIGAFRLAGKDINLLKLWGLVFQNGGGHALTVSQGWKAILPLLELPEEFPQVQANGNKSVALALEQYYTMLLYPFEESFRANISAQQNKARQALGFGQAIASGQGRPSMAQLGMHGQPSQRPSAGNQVSLIGQPGLHVPSPSSTASAPSFSQPLPTPQPPLQRPSSPALNPHHPAQGHSSMTDAISMPPVPHIPDINLLDQDLQGIKRKLDMDDGDSKRARQKTEPPEASTLGVISDHNSIELASTSSQPLLNATPKRKFQQPLRRKIEYIPLAREIDTYGGRDLKFYEKEWTNAHQRRPLRDLNDWGVLDIEALTMSVRSRLSTELSYALTSLTLMSTMRGQAPGTGLPIYDCADLFEEIIDLIEDEAFGGSEDTFGDFVTDESMTIITHRDMANAIYETESLPFVVLETRQGSRDANLGLGLRQRPANIILATLNIIRNLSLFTNNYQWMARHGRCVDVLLRLCDAVTDDSGLPRPTSPVLSLPDLIKIRKDALYILMHLAGYIDLSPESPHPKSNSRIGRRAFALLASYIVDPYEAVAPLTSIQQVGRPIGLDQKPSLLTDLALEVFTRLTLSDSNRHVLAKIINSPSILLLLGSLVHRLPVTDSDFQLISQDTWLSYTEKVILSIYSLLFLSSPEMKLCIKADRKLGFKSVVLRFIVKFLQLPNHDWFFLVARRAIEAMKLLDDAGDMFDTSDASITPIMSFGMGYGETGVSTAEKGTGLLGGHRDLALEMLLFRDIHADRSVFGEVESLTRVEPQQLHSVHDDGPPT